MSKRAVLCARVSGDDRGKDGRNLAGQLEMGRQYALQQLDLYLSGDFPKDILTDRKTRLQATIDVLNRERTVLVSQLEMQALADGQVESISTNLHCRLQIPAIVLSSAPRKSNWLIMLGGRANY